jgi:hypothetical protein
MTSRIVVAVLTLTLTAAAALLAGGCGKSEEEEASAPAARVVPSPAAPPTGAPEVQRDPRSEVPPPNMPRPVPPGR